jgi:hypothetical protein
MQELVDNELQVLASASKAKKGRLDGATRARAIALLCASWSGAPSVEPYLRSANEFQSDLVGDALQRCWGNLAEARRRELLHWLQEGKTERAIRRRLLAAAAISGSDPGTGLALLIQVLPAERVASKDLREMVVATLFGSTSIDFVKFAADNASNPQALQLLFALLQIALDRNLPTELMQRFKVVQACLVLLSKQPSGAAIWGEVLPRIDSEIRRWPTQLRLNLRAWLAAESPRLCQEVFGDDKEAQPTAVAAPQPVSLRESGRSGNGSPPPSIPESIRALERYIDLSVSQIRDLAKLREALDAAAALIDGAKERETRLQSQVDRVTSDLERAQSALQNMQQRLAASEAKTAETSARAEQQKEHLTRQIETRANANVEEFRHRLSAVLSKLIVDLPPGNAQMDAELGHVILLQFHHFIDQLEQRGIPLRKRK